MPSVFRILVYTFIVLFAIGIANDPKGFRFRSSSAEVSKLDYLLQQLEHAKDYKVRIAAATRLGKIADGTVADWMLRAFRRERNSAVRLATLIGIGGIPDYRILSPLIEIYHQLILNDQERLMIERILWTFRDSVDNKAWAKTLRKSKDGNLRVLAAWLLGLVGTESDLKALKKGTSDKATSVRLGSVMSIGKIGSSRGKKICERRRKKDASREVRTAAKKCLRSIRNPLPSSDKRSHRRPLRVSLKRVPRNTFGPKTWLGYRQYNLNPRSIDIAAYQLLPNQPENRSLRTIPLLNNENYRKTLRVDAQVSVREKIRKSDVKRIKEKVRSNAGQINRCYLDQQKKKPKLGGTLMLGFQISKRGKVENAGFQGGTLSDRSVRNCILSKVKKLRFPSLALDQVEFFYTYTFVPPKDKKYDF